MKRRLLRFLFTAFTAVLVLAVYSVSSGAGTPTIENQELPPDYQIEGPGENSNPCSTGVNTSCPYCSINLCGCALPIPGYQLDASCECGCSNGQSVCTRRCSYSRETS